MAPQRLFQELKITEIRGILPDRFAGVAYLPEALKPGFLFVALAEYLYYNRWVEGHDLIRDAAAAGATAAVVERFDDTLTTLPQVKVANSREALAVISDNAYDQPFSDMTVIGVTGTNGKTTTSHIIAAICQAGGYTPGIIGTTGYYWGGSKTEAIYTTPLALELRELTATMRDAGVNLISMEASSHAIKLDRVKHVPFRVGVFTNLTRDHLDFHGTMEDYRNTKRTFFARLGCEPAKLAHAVINLDDPVAQEYIKATKATVLTYSVSQKADVQVLASTMNLDGILMTVKLPTGIVLELKSSLVGPFNIQNILAAVGAACALSIKPTTIQSAIEGFTTVPGRFQRIDCGQDFLVIVDYAHTPDALERALKTARTVTSGKLIVVFGCGGDRDRGKRPEMGKLGADLADLAIVTSDNPRTENPETIIQEIVAGIPAPAAHVLTITARRDAITQALAQAQAGDIVLIAGKGHENYQIIGTTKYPFSDEAVVRSYFRDKQAAQQTPEG